MRVRYLVSYSGPSYSSDLDRMYAVSSISEARQLFRNFRNGAIESPEYWENEDQIYVLWNSSKYSFTDGTTEMDVMEIWPVAKTEGGYMRSFEPSHLIRSSERGGVIVDKY